MSNDQLVELAKQVAILTQHADDFEKNNQHTFAQIQAQIGHIQAQVGTQFGAQVEEIARTSEQYIIIVSILFATVSIGTTIYFFVLGGQSRRDFKEYAGDMRTDIRTDLEKETKRLSAETDTFREQIQANQLMLTQLKMSAETLKPAHELEAEIEAAVNAKYQPPTELKRDMIELLLYNHEFSEEFQTLLQNELRRLGGNQPPISVPRGPFSFLKRWWRRWWRRSSRR